MMQLTREVFQKVEGFIQTQGRELEKAHLSYLFHNGSAQAVVDALIKYQNEDGGFGHGLEPDFVMPVSSPMASTIAFQIIGEISGENAETLIEQGIRYFESTFQPERIGWYAVSAEVNDYPHAPWWNYLSDQQLTVIDYSWGNPSAEIIGYLYKYRAYVSKLDIDALLEHAITYFLQKTEFGSEHEIYCFLRMYNELPVEKQVLLKEKLTDAVQSLVKTNVADWNDYTPQPVHFIQKPGHPMFGITEEAIKTNLDYLLESLTTHSAILPNWEWGQYPDAWQVAKAHWTGIMTIRTLQVLRNFGRLEW